MFLQISNATRTEIIGSVNGIAASIAAFSKLVAPAIGTAVFAWSANLDLFYPLNYMFIFHVLVIVAIISFLITFLLPSKLNRNRAA